MLRRAIPLILIALLAGCAAGGDRSDIPQASVGSGGGGDWSRGGD
ncbi:hypothetical protein [Azospirillum agricola]|nr:hypothetical protein [Azospirillum agricola]SMH54276.1 hypothetical protein SAMN02982994_3524 [Azospirillum lipoferum]